METTPQPEKKNKNTLLLMLLAVSVLLNIYQWRKQSNTVMVYDQRVDTLIHSRADVMNELDATRSELNTYQGMNNQLDSLLANANQKIDEQDKRIKNLIKKEKSTMVLNEKLKGELDELRRMREEYLSKIDSLLITNQALAVEKEMLNSSVRSLTQNLESTVNTASVLAAEYFKVTPFKKKSEGKYTTTALAKRTNKVEVCFDVLENKIAKAGEKNVYLRILTPEGKVMGERATGSGTFKKSGSNEEVMYSTSSVISYSNAKQNVCLAYEENVRIYPKGTFNVEIYVDGNLSGATTFTLK